MRYSTGIQESLDTIFSGIVMGDVKKDNPLIEKIINCGYMNIARFTSHFPNNIFQDEYAILYSILIGKGITIATSSQCETILRNNMDLILDSPYVDISRMLGMNLVNLEHAPTNEEKADVVIDHLKGLIETLSNRWISEEQFSSTITIFKDWYKEASMLEVSQNMTLIMSDSGFDERLPGKRRRVLKGSEDAQQYFREKSKEIQNLIEFRGGDDTLIDANWYARQDATSGNNRSKRLLKLPLPEITKFIGWIRRGHMIGILGAPKGGKTTLANFMASEALDANLNVAVWPVEGSKEEWMSKQLALRIKKDNNISVSSKVIMELETDGTDNDGEVIEISHNGEIREVKKSGLRKIVNAAKLRMATDPLLGRLSFIEGALYLETMEEKLTSHYNDINAFDVIVVDSLVNMGSLKGGSKSEILSKGYMNLKRYTQKEMPVPAMSIVPAQFKQEAVEYIRKHPDEPIDETSGGETAETIRTPDEVIGVFSTKEEKEAGMFRLSHVASRHGANFKDFFCGCDLQCSYFWSRPELNQ